MVALVFAASVVALATIIPAAMGVRSVQCDGNVPMWMIPADYTGSGCVEIRPWWEWIIPGHDTRMVCLGLCLDGKVPYLPPAEP